MSESRACTTTTFGRAPTSYKDLYTEFPDVERFVVFDHLVGYTDDEEAARVASQVAEDMALSLDKPMRLVVLKEQEANKQMQKIERAIQNLLASNTPFYDKIKEYLRFQIDIGKYEAIIEHYRQHGKLICGLLMLINGMKKDCPTTALRIVISALGQSISNVPTSDDAKQKKIDIGKKTRMMKEASEIEKANILMDSLMVKGAAAFGALDDYFPDGETTTIFEKLFVSLHSPQRVKMNERMTRCKSTPEECGATIIDACNDLISVFKLIEKKASAILFLVISRCIFADLYDGEWKSSLCVVDYCFSVRITKLLHLHPTHFPHLVKFLPDEYHALEMCAFPEDHAYQKAVETVNLMTFQICPIDFCATAERCLSCIQEAAVLVRKEPDYALSTDEMLDIALMVVTQAMPLELPAMIKAFDPYVRGLGLPSHLKFAFTTFRAVCDNIVSIDLSDL